MTKAKRKGWRTHTKAAEFQQTEWPSGKRQTAALLRLQSPQSVVSPFQIPLVKQNCPASTRSKWERNCLVRRTHWRTLSFFYSPTMTSNVLLLSPPRPVPALLWRGGLLQIAPVSQQQRPVLVRGSLWQRGGWISYPWTGQLRWAQRNFMNLVLENLESDLSYFFSDNNVLKREYKKVLLV